MNTVLWIVATLVTEWALKTIWREYVEPFFVARSHAKAAADREEEAEELAWLAQASSDVVLTPNERSIYEYEMRRLRVEERMAYPLRIVHLRADQ